MLLLVLILVVLAFGLLVFALQAGSVLAAWVSVGLSVAAALVLLVDWLQRRSAMRAGAASLEAVSERPPQRDRDAAHDPEPATEVLPVIPPSGPLPVQDHGPAGADSPTMVGSPHGTPDEGGVERDADAEPTVLMPAVQPSGSSARPSGATPGVTGSSGSSSLSVTKSGSPEDLPDPAEDAPEPAASSAATAVVDTRKRPVDDAAADHAVGGADVSATKDAGSAADPREQQDEPAADASHDPATDGPGRSDRPAGPSGQPDPEAAPTGDRAGALAATAGAVGARSAGTDDDTRAEPSSPAQPPAAPAQFGGAPGRAGDSNLSGSDLFGSGAAPAQAGAAVGRPGGSAAVPPGRQPDGAPPQVDQPAGPPPGQWPGGPDPRGQDPRGHWQPHGDPQQAASGPPSRPHHDQHQPVHEQADPSAEAPTMVTAPAGDPPVEQSDPAAAAIVATLDVDVVVIDEQPRYHVAGCTALAAAEPIPLPAREAVELGFTPCGWCLPDHTLAERYPAATR